VGLVRRPNTSSGRSIKEEMLLWLVGFGVLAAEVMNLANFWDIAHTGFLIG
jgi:hypothetical protein